MSISDLYIRFLECGKVTTDSRVCPENSMFFALKGDNFNGNKFAKTALEKGCKYAVVDEKDVVDNKLSYILVDNVLETLQKLATYHRNQLKTTIIGITGTNGKTTTKELTAAVLSKKYNVLFTQGNLNNHIGVPLTLLNLTANHNMAVVEMGANHKGEIMQSALIAQPNYGLITNVGKAHLEGFGSFQGVIDTKGELYQYLLANNGKAFVNADDDILMNISKQLSTIKYGCNTKEGVAVCGKLKECNPLLSFYWNNNENYEVNTQMVGAYNINNMLAAVCIGNYFGVDSDDICAALSEYKPQNNRSQLTKTEKNTLIVDTYNANPTSMKVAIDNFTLINAPQKMAIIGAMKELGEASFEEHKKIVEQLQQTNIGEVWLVGDEFADINTEYKKFSDVNKVKTHIETLNIKDTCVLIKGSNSIKLFELPQLL